MSVQKNANHPVERRGRRQAASFLVLLCFAVVGALLLPSDAAANDIYISQNGTGGGSSCGDTFGSAWFNAPGNWGSGATKIGPGTTVHLCGTFTGDTFNAMLIAQGNGATGNPVTIKFETGATLTSPAWNRAIILDGHDHFVVDGGTTCGWVGMVLVNCNGSIQNTLNGTPGNACPGGACTQHNPNTLGISASPSNDIEIKNLAIVNMYMISGGEDSGGSPGPGCIHFYADNAHTGFNIHNNVFTWAGWCLNGGQNSVTIANNDFHFIDHGLGMGQYTNGASTVTGVSFHDNHYHDAYVWDSPSNDFHHDGVHLFSYSASQTTNVNAIITNINIYNNLFDGDFGNNNTANIFFEGGEQNANIFNNVSIVAPGRQLDNGLYNGYGKNINVFNNTVIGPGGSQTQKYSIFNGPNFVIKNNVYTDGGMISVKSPYPFDCPGNTPCQTVSYALSNNAYLSPVDLANGFGSLINGFYNYSASGFAGFESDTGETGAVFTDNGHPTSTYLNKATGAENSGSPTIGAGANLTSLCNSLGIPGNPCNADIAGGARPASGAWDIGAFQSGSVGSTGGSGSNAPVPPTGLSAIVQ